MYASTRSYGGGGRKAAGVVACILKPPSFPLTVAKERRETTKEEEAARDPRAEEAIEATRPTRDMEADEVRCKKGCGKEHKRSNRTREDKNNLQITYGSAERKENERNR